MLQSNLFFVLQVDGTMTAHGESARSNTKRKKW